MTDVSRADEGMSLVELIVGLAIASALALAIGGLLTFSIQARERVERAARIEDSLVELKIAAGLLDQLTPIDATFRLAARGADLVMTFEAPGRNPRTLVVRLAAPTEGSTPAELRFEDARGRVVGPLALEPFDGAYLEFLTWRAGRLAWLRYPDTLDAPLSGIRVVLNGEGREWPVLLWAARTRSAS